MSTIRLADRTVTISTDAMQAIVRDPTIDELDLRDISACPPCGRVRQLYRAAFARPEVAELLDGLGGPIAHIVDGAMSREWFLDEAWIYDQDVVAITRTSERVAHAWVGQLEPDVAAAFWVAVAEAFPRPDTRLPGHPRLTARRPHRHTEVWLTTRGRADDVMRLFGSWLAQRDQLRRIY